MVNDEKCKVLKHEEIGAGYRYLVVEAPDMASRLEPGQFIHVKVPGLEASALRRPFSVFDAENGIVTVLYKTVGRGTEMLNRVEVGETLMIEGPLGYGTFPVEVDGVALLVGGGFGVAPLHFLAKRIKCNKVKLFVGGRTKDDLLALDRFAALGVEVAVATNDGSAGVKGFVVDPLDEEIRRLREQGEKFELFTCGPDGLLKAVADRAVSLGVPGWISMDRHMICGVGACFACIQRTKEGNQRCCVNGPVFRADTLLWD
jgi:dihydroorotate dehydrogenase electron transfer subunit